MPGRPQRGNCPVCQRNYALAPFDGTLRAHPPGGPYCAGSGEVPAPGAAVTTAPTNFVLAAEAAANLGLDARETAEALLIPIDRAQQLLALADPTRTGGN